MTSKRELRRQLNNLQKRHDELRDGFRNACSKSKNWRDNYLYFKSITTPKIEKLERRVNARDKYIDTLIDELDKVEHERDLANADALRYAAEVQVLRDQLSQAPAVTYVSVSGDAANYVRSINGNYGTSQIH